MHAFFFRGETEESESVRTEAGVQMRLDYIKLNDSRGYSILAACPLRSFETYLLVILSFSGNVKKYFPGLPLELTWGSQPPLG